MSDWIIKQKWSDLVFLSYEVDKNYLQSLLPLELKPDLYEDKAYLSIVPFTMSDIRFKFTPNLPFSKLYELNLRTYVQYKKTKGIYFFTLDSDHRLGNFIAREFFNLPYRYARVSITKPTNENVTITSPNSIDLSINIKDQNVNCDFSRWLTERYCLFTKNKKDQILRGDVSHESWSLKEAEIASFNDNFSKQFGFSSENSSFHCVFSEGLDVRFQPFKKV